MKTRILIIDEDQELLQVYREALEPKSVQWDLTCASKASEALALAASTQPEIVVVSYALEGATGVETLAELERLLPNAQRFLAAAENEKPQLEAHIGSSFQFLPRPCPAQRLVSEIQRSLAIESWLGNARIKEIVAKMGEFPSLPPVYLKVMNAVNAADASAERISQAISADLAITAKVLLTVNSSYYGFEEKISDITEAVGILGVQRVKNLILAVQVFNKLGRSANSKSITDQLWHHSMSVAVAARRISAYELDDEKAAEEAYTAGLMHDIGKLILLNAAPEAAEAARALSREKRMPLWQAENELIGCNHAETGAYLLGRWGMPASLVEAVALHHEPVNSFGQRFTALAAVHVANALLRSRQSADHPDAQPDQSFLAEIGKADSWSEWQQVTSGKTIEKPARAPSARPERLQPSRRPAMTAVAQPQSGTLRSTERKGEAQEARLAALAPIGLALAACFGISAGIYFFSQPESASSAEETLSQAVASHESTEPEALIDPDALTEEALEELYAVNTPETHEPAEPEATLVPVQEPEVSLEVPALEPARAAMETPIEIAIAEPAAALPKPRLPEPERFFPQIQLGGIFFNSDNPLASVNGKIRRVGDSVAGAQIVQIEQQRILVRYEDELRAFKLK